MRSLVTMIIAVAALSAPLAAQTATCPDKQITVIGADAALHDMICRSVETAETLFETCGVPALNGNLKFSVLETLKPGCLAQYHCGTDSIDVLNPSRIADIRDAEGAFSFLPVTTYFESIIVHEVTHAALDSTPCPFSDCVVSNEYVAYVMQVLSLSPEDQKKFVEEMNLDRKVSRDELNAPILYMAPKLFARKAWVHFSQRDDPCGFIRQVSEGIVLLDREHP